MAKKRNSKNKKTLRKSRVYTKDPLRSFLGLDVPNYPQYRLQEISAGGMGPYQKPKAKKGYFLAPNNPSPTPTKPVDLYQAPKTVVVTSDRSICSRRQARKEVIHAFNHAGKAGQKKQVRTATSNIHCKG